MNVTGDHSFSVISAQQVLENQKELIAETKKWLIDDMRSLRVATERASEAIRRVVDLEEYCGITTLAEIQERTQELIIRHAKLKQMIQDIKKMKHIMGIPYEPD